MISGYSQNGHPEDVVAVFHCTLGEGVRPEEIAPTVCLVLVHVSHACS